MIGASFERLHEFQFRRPDDLDPAVARALKILASFPRDNPDPVLCISAEGRLMQANTASRPILADWQTREGHMVPLWLQQEVRAALQTNATRQFERDSPPRSYEWKLVPLQQEQITNLYGRDITAWRTAEHKLRDREVRTRLILEAAPDCIKLVDADLKLIEINAAGLGFLEADSPDQVVGLSCSKLVHPEDRQVFEEVHRAVFRGQSGQLTFRITGLKGTARWLETRVVPLGDEQGEIYAAVGITRDITRLLRTTQELRVSEHRYRSYVDSAPHGVFLLDESGHFHDLNPAAHRLTGYPREELLQRRFTDLLPTNALSLGRRALTELRQQGAFQGEFPFVAKGGGNGWMAVSAVRLDEHQYLAYATDITVQKNAENEVRRERDFNARILDTAPVIILLLDALGNIQYANSHFEHLTGWQLREILGKDWIDTFVPPAERERIRTLLAKATAGTPTRGSINSIITRRGDQRVIEWNDQAIRNENGQITSLLTVGVDVTDRQAIQEALCQSEEQLRLSLQAAGQGFYDLDLVTGDAKVSPEYAVMLGYDPAVFKESNASWANRLHPDDRETVYATFEAYIRGEIPAYEVEFRQRTSAGDWLWTLSIGSIVARDASGRPLRMLGTHTNIDRRKRAEAAVHENEVRTREILNGIFAFVGVYDLDGTLIDANDAPLRAAGLNRAEVLGLPFWDTYWWNYDADVQAELKSAMKRAAQGEVVRYEPKVRIVGDAMMDIDVTFSPLRNTDGKITHILGFGVDITERTQAAVALRTSEARLREAQRIACIGNWELDLTTQSLYWSDEIFKIFEIEPTPLATSYDAFIATVHPDDRTMVHHTYTQSVENRQPYDLVHRLLMTDGRIKFVRERCETHYDAAGQPRRSVGTVQDVTSRVLAEESMQRLRDDLTHVTRMGTLGELAAGLAHELNQPLGAIALHAHVAMRLQDSSNNSQLADCLQKISDQSLRAGDIIRRLRNMVKRRPSHCEHCDLNELILEVLQLQRSELQTNHVNCQLELAPQLPAVSVDAVQIQQVFLNLILNAIEAMASPSIQQRTLTVTTKWCEDLIQATVQDTGGGIPPAVRDSLFEPFLTTKAGGLGVGLSVSRTIIEAHGGRLWVVADEGMPTTFVVELRSAEASA